MLAVAEAIYLVLSMERPNWVIYAVKGKLGENDVPSETLLDLENKRKNGEEFKNFPVSERELKNVLRNLGGL